LYAVKGSSNTKNGNVNRVSFGADEPPNPKENYAAFLDGLFLYYFGVPTTDTEGRMKLTRVGSIMTGYFFNQASQTWQEINSHDYSSTGLGEWIRIGLNALSARVSLNPGGQLVHPFGGQDVEIAFDNLRLTYEKIKYLSPGMCPGLLLLD